jgi:hypothetical protein
VNSAADLRARVLEATRREPAKVRAQARRQTVALWVAGAAAGLGVFFAIGGPHAGGRTGAEIAGVAVVWAACAFGATRAALARGTRGLGLPAATLLAVAIGTAPVMFVLFALVGGEPAARPSTLGCALATVGMAAALLVAMVLSRRGGDPAHPGATGAAFGAAAGAWAAVLIDLHCARGDLAHVGLGHVLPVLALGAVGAVLGSRLLGVRTR